MVAEMRALGLAVVLAALCLAASGGLRAQEAGRTVFTFAIDGDRATELVVRSGPAGDARIGITDSEGAVDFDLVPGWLQVIDSQTGATLIARFIDEPASEIVVPMPIRFTGRLLGFGTDPTAVTLHFGYGPDLPLADYQRLEHDMRLSPSPGENSAFGLDLPPVPARWIEGRPRADGIFYSPWVPVDGRVELIVRHADGRTAMVPFAPYAGLAPYSVVSLPDIQVQFAGRVEIAVAPADTALPLVLDLGISDIAVEGPDAVSLARRLSLLNRVDRDLGQLLTGRRRLQLDLEGQRRLIGVPPMEALSYYLTSPTPGIAREGRLTVPRDGAATVAFEASAMLGDRGNPATVAAIAVFDDGAPAAGARVVYSSYPDRFETAADADGRFVFEGVPRDRDAVIFIDAPVDGAPPFDRVTQDFRVAAPVRQGILAAASGDRRFVLARPTAGAAPSAVPAAATGPGSGIGGGQDGGGGFGAGGDVPQIGSDFYDFCNGRYTMAEDDPGVGPFSEGPVFAAFRWVSGENGVGVEEENIVINATSDLDPRGAIWAQITFPAPGQYTLTAQFTPFIYADYLTEIRATELTRSIYFQVNPESIMTEFYFAVLQRGGAPVPAGVQLSYSALSKSVDPFQNETNAEGVILINCLNTQWFFTDGNDQTALPVFVDSDTEGYFDGFVPVVNGQRGAFIQLGNRPTE